MIGVMQKLLLGFIGISSGIAVAAALYTFLTLTGVVNRLLAVTHTTLHSRFYEWMLIAGGVGGNLSWLYEPVFHLPYFILGVVGLIVGVYTGCIIGAIEEVMDSIPILMRRAHLKKGVSVVIMGLAIGKAVGIWVWYFLV